jgi:hypothetical protein
MEPVKSFPDIMLEPELITYLRIPEISKAGNHRNVIANLKRSRGLPCLHISNNCVYPRQAIDAWVQRQTAQEVQS